MEMEIAFVFVFIGTFLLGVFLYGVIVFNGLVRVKNEVNRAWANIDVILKERHDEIPKLLKSIESYMQYEQGTMMKIVEARNRFASSKSMPERASATAALSGALNQLFAIAERYPDLKANTNYIQLQQRISSLEENIADRRELYNATVTNYNVRLEQFPDLLVARTMNYQSKELFQAAAEDRTDVEIHLKIPA